MKKWFSSVSRNGPFLVQPWNGDDRFEQGSCLIIYFARYILLQKKSFESSPSLVSFCSSKKLDSLSLLWMNACVLKTQTVLWVFSEQRWLVLSCFPSRTRTALFPLVRDLSRCLREWKKWLTWFLLAVPKSQYLALTFHFRFLVLSDCHLMQPGRSSPWSSACTENWGFDRQGFWGNYLCRECTETALSNRTVWCKHTNQKQFGKIAATNKSLSEHASLREAFWFLWSAERCVGGCSVSQQPNNPAMWLTHLWWVDQRWGSCLPPASLCPTNQSSPECGVRGDQVLRTRDCFHSPLPRCSAKISLAPMQLLALNFFLCLQVTPGSEVEWSQIDDLRSG